MNRHISNAMGFMFITIALLVDALQAFLNFIFIGVLINPLIDVIMWMVFGLWFNHVGVKRQASLAFTAIAEFIPIINSLPVWTGYMVFVVASSKLKEVSKEAGQGVV